LFHRQTRTQCHDGGAFLPKRRKLIIKPGLRIFYRKPWSRPQIIYLRLPIVALLNLIGLAHICNQEKGMFKSFLTSFFAIAALIGIAACNTIEGAGKDIEKGGDKIEQSAKNHNN
jgi:predicted small secreted protein